MTASKIEWTDRSDWNPVRGCTRVTEACVNCYAEIMAARFSNPGMWGHGFAEIVQLPGGGIDHRWTGKVELQHDRLLKPLTWRKPAKVFPNSTSDFFHEKLPFEHIDKLFAVMALTPHLTYQVLTKRPERMREYITPARAHPVCLEALGLTLEAHQRDSKSTVGTGVMLQGDIAHLQQWPLPNVWLGTSVHDQASADEFIPHLLATPAAVRFISAEPLLGPVSLRWAKWDDWKDKAGKRRRTVDHLDGARMLDWVIAGGESGPGARPMHTQWVRDLRDECVEAQVPFFFKQHGEWVSISFDDLASEEIESEEIQEKIAGFIDQPMRRVGKKAAGRLLDGKEHNGFPVLRAGAEAA
jgi:protein gp37